MANNFKVLINRLIRFSHLSDGGYEKSPLGIGLTLMTPVGARQNVSRRKHRRLGEYYDCHTEVQRALWRGFGMTLDELKVLDVS